MTRLIGVLSALGALQVLTAPCLADTVDPRKDLEEFQAYFKRSFPEIPFDEYSNGLYALPAAAARRAEWEQIEEFPPYELEVEMGRNYWEENNLGKCFKNGGVGIAQNYPYWDKERKMFRTAELDINDCLVRNGKTPIKDLKKGTMAQVVAYFRYMSRGNRLSPQIDLSDPAALAEYEYGRRYFWAKRGQLNFACADCHIQSAGKYIGGNILSTALGHGAGFPAYRSKWGGLGTIHRRYGGCNSQVRAAPLDPQSREYRALEFYEAYMNTGLPLTAPSQRF
jgi:sulfur-oxidizing protein SoxA